MGLVSAEWAGEGILSDSLLASLSARYPLHTPHGNTDNLYDRPENYRSDG
jgi:hypothetical protein